MTRLVRFSVLVAGRGLFALPPADSSASGWLHRGCGGCDTGCAPACAPAAAAPAPAPQYEERKVTRYKPVMREREIVENVCRLVSHQEKYTYTCMVPVTHEEKRVVTCYERVS